MSVDETLAQLDHDALRALVQHALQQAAVALPRGPLPPGTETATLSLVPREDGLAPKDIPVDALLNKVTMMRDKLRLVEQRVNAADGMPAAQRLALQGLLTQAYRALQGVDPLLRVAADAPPPPAGTPE